MRFLTVMDEMEEILLDDEDEAILAVMIRIQNQQNYLEDGM